LGHRIRAVLKTTAIFLSKYRLPAFYAGSILWLELVYRLWSLKDINADFLFAALFSLSAGTALFFLTGLFKDEMNRIVALSLTLLLFFIYAVQLVYFSIFQTPLSFFSLTGAGDALQFQDIIGAAIIRNMAGILLLLIPAAFLTAFKKSFRFTRMKSYPLCVTFLVFIAIHSFAVLCVNLTGDSSVSQRSLYYKVFSPSLSVSRLGLLTTMRLDLARLAGGTARGAGNKAAAGAPAAKAEIAAADTGRPAPAFAERPAVLPGTGQAPDRSGDTAAASDTGVKKEAAGVTPLKTFNLMDIDFGALAANEKDPVIKDMHGYFSSVAPTATNKYTGIFKGDNLILITAEAFSPYAVSPGLTPTLYRMSREGFVFNSFYNPIWGVSTSDGEYVACTGLIPKPGVWSFARSGSNYLPFVMGNQLKRLGYTVKAYHNHTYTYYKRNISHPNMGYDYKGVGNGLEMENTWPESDLEMIAETSGDFINTGPFHNYYMTVSGHMNYSFRGNYMAMKNRERVEKLPLSEASKAYIACNLELEDAMALLLEKLEAAGIAEKTVIALSADHYPYGLPRECIDELAGHRVESNFELYRSVFILWKKGMEPVIIDKPCSSLDINPTLSNLFGLEYDSRLLMGRDILSDSPPLVIFSDYSWITDRARFNAGTNTAVFTDGTREDAKYIEEINGIVADKFEYSEKILDEDYYGRLFAH
jgi:lipoteichoic acid synthase